MGIIKKTKQWAKDVIRERIEEDKSYDRLVRLRYRKEKGREMVDSKSDIDDYARRMRAVRKEVRG